MLANDYKCIDKFMRSKYFFLKKKSTNSRFGVGILEKVMTVSVIDHLNNFDVYVYMGSVLMTKCGSSDSPSPKSTCRAPC